MGHQKNPPQKKQKKIDLENMKKLDPKTLQKPTLSIKTSYPRQNKRFYQEIKPTQSNQPKSIQRFYQKTSKNIYAKTLRISTQELKQIYPKTQKKIVRGSIQKIVAQNHEKFRPRMKNDPKTREKHEAKDMFCFLLTPQNVKNSHSENVQIHLLVINPPHKVSPARI